jgi:hypothetical protein
VIVAGFLLCRRSGRGGAGLWGCGSRRPCSTPSLARRLRLSEVALVTLVRTAVTISSSQRETIAARVTSLGMSSFCAHQSQKAESRSGTCRSHGCDPLILALRFRRPAVFPNAIRARAICCPCPPASRVWMIFANRSGDRFARFLLSRLFSPYSRSPSFPAARASAESRGGEGRRRPSPRAERQ